MAFMSMGTNSTLVPTSQAGGEGETTSKIIIVGDVPFNQTTKNIFEQCLHISGLTRSDCYITHIFKDKFSADKVYDKKKKRFLIDTNPYINELRQELSNCRGNIIVAIGEAALLILTDMRLKSVYTWRGSILDYTFNSSAVKMMPVLHPSTTLITYLDRYKIIADLRRVKEQAEFPEIRRTARTLLIAPTFHGALAYLDKVKKSKRVAFDIECNGALEVSCISFAVALDDCMSIPFYKSYWSLDEEVVIWKGIADILGDEKIEKIGQNLMFDIAFLMKKNDIITKGVINDTMVAQGILYPDFPKGLDFLCSYYTEEPYYKDEGKIWKTPGSDSRQFWTYNAKDSATTLEIWDVLWEQIKLRKYEEAYANTMRIFNPLLFMQAYGIRADREALEETKIEVEAHIEDIQRDLDKMCGKPLNPNSNKQCQMYFYVEKGIKPYFNGDSITTDDKAMQRIARLGHKEAKYIQEIRSLVKLKGTYLDIKFDEDSRLRCSYNPVGTTTSRLSSSKTIFGTGTNFQNIPPEFRAFLKPDLGSILIEVDKVQAEWIAVAYISGDANMIEVVEKKMDAHVRTASLMFDIDMEEVTPELRKKGKTCNHALNYDMGYKGFALTYGFREIEARELVRRYHSAYPGIRLWHEKVQNQLSSDRTLYNCFGRPRRFLERWGDTLWKSAYAYNPQSTVVQVVNTAMWKAYDSKLLPYLYLIGQVHDSLLGQHTYDKMDSLMHSIRKIVEYLDIPIPCNGRVFIIPTEIKIGFDWGNMVGISKGDYDWDKIRGLIDEYIKTNKPTK